MSLFYEAARKRGQMPSPSTLSMLATSCHRLRDQSPTIAHTLRETLLKQLEDIGHESSDVKALSQTVILETDHGLIDQAMRTAFHVLISKIDDENKVLGRDDVRMIGSAVGWVARALCDVDRTEEAASLMESCLKAIQKGRLREEVANVESSAQQFFTSSSDGIKNNDNDDVEVGTTEVNSFANQRNNLEPRSLPPCSQTIDYQDGVDAVVTSLLRSPSSPVKASKFLRSCHQEESHSHFISPSTYMHVVRALLFEGEMEEGQVLLKHCAKRRVPGLIGFWEQI